jgi:hypothetical protein
MSFWASSSVRSTMIDLYTSPPRRAAPHATTSMRRGTRWWASPPAPDDPAEYAPVRAGGCRKLGAPMLPEVTPISSSSALPLNRDASSSRSRMFSAMAPAAPPRTAPATDPTGPARAPAAAPAAAPPAAPSIACATCFRPAERPSDASLLHALHLLRGWPAKVTASSSARSIVAPRRSIGSRAQPGYLPST